MLAYAFYDTDTRVMRYAETLARCGDQVDMIVLRRNGQKRREVLHGVNIFRIQCRSVNEKRLFNYIGRLALFFFRSLLFISFRHLRNPYRLVHVHNVPDFLVFAAWLPKLLGAKIILDIHDLLPELFSNKFRWSHNSILFKTLLLIERISAAFSNHVIVANHLWLERLGVRIGKQQKCSTLINFVDESLFYPSTSKKNNGKFVLLFPGTLNWHQGVDLAIRAFARIAGRFPHAEFHIYGEGQALDTLVALAAACNVADRMRFFDFLPVAEIAEHMREGNLGIIPKRADSFGTEAFSTKILEFMATGIPVLVASTKIDRFYFDESVVRFFQAGSEEDMSENLICLINDQGLRNQLARSALEFVECYKWGANRGVYVALVDRLAV